MNKFILITLLSLMSLNASAKMLDVSVSGDLESNSTPDKLKEKLEFQLKYQAVSNTPSYIEHVQYMSSGTNSEDTFNENIMSLGAGLVDLTNVNTSWKTSDKGIITLTISATADVDMKALDVQIANIRRNRSMEEGIKLAVNEIEKLQRQIDGFDSELATKGEHGQRQRLAVKRDHLISKVLSTADTSTLYQVSEKTRKRLLLSYDLFANKENALEQGHAIGEKIHNYFEKNLVVSPPTLVVKGKNQLDVSFTYGFDPLPIIGLLEKYYSVQLQGDYLLLTPSFNKGTYEGDVIDVVNNYLNIMVGAKVSTVTKWEKLNVKNVKGRGADDIISPFKLYYGHGSDDSSKNGRTTISMLLPDELVANPTGITVGKSI